MTTGDRLSGISRLVESIDGAQSATLVVYGDSHADYIAPLERWIEARGVPVEWSSDLYETLGLVGATGRLSSGGQAIVIDTTTPKNNQLLTLAHEITHVLHGQALLGQRTIAEVLAESTAYETCRRLGLNTQRESMTYLMQFPAPARDEVYRLFGDQIEAWSKVLAEAARGQWVEHDNGR